MNVLTVRSHTVLNATKYTVCWKRTQHSNVVWLKWREKPEDLFAGGCRRSSVEQRSWLLWFKLNGKACQGSCDADTCFNFVLWCREKEKTSEKTEEKRQTEWTEFRIKRRNGIGYQGKTDQWIHFMQKTTNCTCIGVLFREGRKWMIDAFFLTPVRLCCQCVRFTYRVVSLEVIY